MMIKRCLKRDGFTIAELQVSILISILMLTAAILLYIAYWKIFIMGNAYLDVFSNSRVAMEYVARDIRCASQVESSHDGYTTSDNCLVLKVPAIDINGNVIGSRYDHITYKLQGSDLKRIVAKDSLSSRTAGTSTVAHYCNSLSFSSDGVGLSNISNLSMVNTIAIFLPMNKTMLSMSGSGTENVSMNPTTIVGLRNK